MYNDCFLIVQLKDSFSSTERGDSPFINTELILTLASLSNDQARLVKELLTNEIPSYVCSYQVYWKHKLNLVVHMDIRIVYRQD